MPGDHPLTKEPKDSGYEIAEISKKLRAGYPYSAADQKNHSLWKRQIKRHGLSRLPRSACYVMFTHVLPTLCRCCFLCPPVGYGFLEAYFDDSS